MASTAHSYWIPTNRNAQESVTSYVKEIDYVYKTTGAVIPFFLLDSGDVVIEAQNIDVIQRSQQEYPHLSLNHLTLAQQQKIIAQLLDDAKLPADFLELIAPAGINYGAMMNKISIFAAILHTDVIHRRDSDTTLQPRCPSPLEFEMMSLGRFHNGANERAHVKNSSHKKNYIAGSGYVGEWNLDLKPFLNVSPDLFYTFWSSLDVDKALHKSIYDWIESGSKATYQGDSVNVANSEGFYLPEAGNVAIYQLHLLFPSLPSNAMSSDYTLFRLARSLHLPVIFHERRVVHEYHTGRKKNPLPYIMSLVKYCDLRPVYAALEKEISAVVSAGYLSLDQQPQLQVANLLDAIALRNIDERRQKMAKFIEHFIAELYPDDAKNLLQSVNFIVEECCQDYANHAQLMRKWSHLINTAMNSDYLFSVGFSRSDNMLVHER